MRAMRVLMMGLCVVASGCTNLMGVPMDRKSPHAVYLRDASGDCVAIYGFRLGSSKAVIQHVNTNVCQ